MAVESTTKLKRVVPRREESRNVDRHEPSSTRFPLIDANRERGGQSGGTGRRRGLKIL